MRGDHNWRGAACKVGGPIYNTQEDKGEGKGIKEKKTKHHMRKHYFGSTKGSWDELFPCIDSLESITTSREDQHTFTWQCHMRKSKR